MLRSCSDFINIDSHGFTVWKYFFFVLKRSWHSRGFNHGIPANWACLDSGVSVLIQRLPILSRLSPIVGRFMILFQLFFVLLPQAEPQRFVKNVQRGVHALSCVVPQHPHGQFAAHAPLRSLVISAYESNHNTSITIMQIELPMPLARHWNTGFAGWNHIKYNGTVNYACKWEHTNENVNRFQVNRHTNLINQYWFHARAG